MNKPFCLFALAALTATLASSGCATSTARADKARHSAYQTEYPVVWNAVLAATRSEGYDRIKVEDAINGKLISDWHKVERVADSQTSDPHYQGGTDTSGAIFFRVMVTIEGKTPPFKVSVDGEAARYRPGFSSLFPYKHGVDDEPEWVNGRINALYVAVLSQLEQYAVPADSVNASRPLPDRSPGPVGSDGAPANPSGIPSNEPVPRPDPPPPAPSPTP